MKIQVPPIFRIYGKGLYALLLLMFFIISKSQITDTENILYVQGNALVYVNDTTSITDDNNIKNEHKISVKNKTKAQVEIEKNESPEKITITAPEVKIIYSPPPEEQWLIGSQTIPTALLPASSHFQLKAVAVGESTKYDHVYFDDKYNKIFTLYSGVILPGYNGITRSRPPPSVSLLL